MDTIRLMFRILGFVLWISALVSGVVFAILQVAAFEDADTLQEGVIVVAQTVTLPGLLVSILLALSAVYCHSVGRTTRARQSD